MINAYKINKHQNDPNFLTHGHWSKTKLGMQNIHLELIKIFGLCIYKENQTYFKKKYSWKI
jgi:hypothetical protein